jgi:hypothetical protein
MPLTDVQFLEGWVLLADAAEELGISRQALYEAAGKDRVSTLRKVGRKRPVYLIREAELPRIRETLSPSHQRRGRLAHGPEDGLEDQVPGQSEFAALAAG